MKDTFYLHYDENGVFLYPEEKTTVTEREISPVRLLCHHHIRQDDSEGSSSSIQES